MELALILGQGSNAQSATLRRTLGFGCRRNLLTTSTEAINERRSRYAQAPKFVETRYGCWPYIAG